MTVDLSKFAVLNGTAPSTGFVRGGVLGSGTIAQMVLLGVEYIKKGYINVNIGYDYGTLNEAGIQELASQPDVRK